MQETLSDKPVNLVLIIRQFKFPALCLLAALAGCAATGGEEETPAEAAPEREITDQEALVHMLAAEQLGAGDESAQSLQRHLEAARSSDDPEHSEEVTRLAASVGAWEVVAGGAMRWRQLAPEETAARFFLIRAWLQLGEAEAATDELEALVADADDPMLAWQQAAALLAQAPDEDAALEVMERLVERAGNGEQSEALWGQSVLAWRLDDLPRALELGEAAARGSDNLDQLLWTAQLAADLEEYERSLELYRRALEVDPDNVEAQLAMSEILRELEQFEQARALLEGMPEETEVLYTLGIYLVEDELEQEAEAVWRRLAALDEADKATHAFFTAHLARMIGRHDDALAWFERVDDGPMWPSAVLQRALLLAEGDETERARELLHMLRTGEDPDLVEQSWLFEAQILQDAGSYGEAIDLLSEALAEVPGSVPLLYSRALVAVEMDDIELAEQDFRRILQLEPDSALALNALGYTLTDRTDRYQEAYRLISRAMEQTPDDPAVLDSMGWVYFKMDRPEQALDYLRRALEGEYNAEIAAHLGEVLWALGERDEAMMVLNEAFERDPEDGSLLRTRKRLGL